MIAIGADFIKNPELIKIAQANAEKSKLEKAEKENVLQKSKEENRIKKNEDEKIKELEKNKQTQEKEVKELAFKKEIEQKKVEEIKIATSIDKNIDFEGDDKESQSENDAVSANQTIAPLGISTKDKKLSNIITKTIPKIIENDTPKNIDNIKLIIEEAKLVTEESMQDLIAGILAQEYNEPNSVPRKTINIIKSLSKPDLELFSKYLSLCIFDDKGVPFDFISVRNIYLELEYTIDEIMTLTDLGLITPMTVGCTILEPNEESKVHEKEPYFNKYVSLSRSQSVSNNNLISFAVYPLSQSGVLICRFLKFEENIQFTNWIEQQLINRGVEFKLIDNVE